MPHANAAPQEARQSHPVDAHVGARLRMRRKALEISQEKLADALGITFQQVQKYERGGNRVSASKLYAAARFLKTTPGWFFDGLPVGDATPDQDPVNLEPVMVMAGLPHGVELARDFVRLATSQDRRCLADLAARLARPAEVLQ